jgi:hypothetical protein
MTTIAKPGAELAASLMKQSRTESLHTPMDTLLEGALAGKVTEDGLFRVLGRLWTLKRMMYYIYGGWAMGINVNEYPATMDYLFSKQLYDDSTHEMQYVDEILRRKMARTQSRAFAHDYCKFSETSRVAYYIFSLRALANYSQNIRIAAMNLGAKVIELEWLERLGASYPDPHVRAIFAGQVAETRSHVLMGKLIVERFVISDVDTALARNCCAATRKNYLFALEEFSNFALGIPMPEDFGEAEIPEGVE